MAVAARRVIIMPGTAAPYRPMRCGIRPTPIRAPTETDQIDAWHATGVFDPDSGQAIGHVAEGEGARGRREARSEQA